MLYHPLAPLIVVQAVVTWVTYAGARLGLWTRPTRRTVNTVLIVNIVALVGVWLFRLATGAFDTLG